MTTLRVFVFGGVRIAHDDLASSLKLTHTVQGLLAFLLIQPPRMHPRELLMEVAWGDRPEDQARSCLSTALWRLRRALEPEGIPRGTYLVTNSAGEVSFNWESDHWVDALVFDRQITALLRSRGQQLNARSALELEQTLQLYAGELLEGFYADWALRDRERLRSLYVDSLAQLLHYYRAAGNYEKSLAFGQRILEQDPLREEIHRELIHLHAQNGQRALAVRQYKACREVLAQELGIAPMPETEALYRQIVSSGDVPPVGAQDSCALDQVKRRLESALYKLEQARVEFQQTMHLVEKLIERDTERGQSEPKERR